MEKNLKSSALLKLQNTKSEEKITGRTVEQPVVPPAPKGIKKRKKEINNSEKETTTIQISSKVLTTIRIYSKLVNLSMSSIIEEQLEKYIKSNKIKDQINEFME